MPRESERTIEELAARHGVSVDAVLVLKDAVARGQGRMVQFSHPDLGGSGQWMSGGMTMVGDMFNNALKARVAAICEELSAMYAADPAASRSSFWFTTPPAAAWWPEELGKPSQTGGQNTFRYAIFPDKHRLATDVDGRITVYETLDYVIGGVSQQQGAGMSFTLSTNRGTISTSSLSVVGDGAPSTETSRPETASPAPADILDTLARLAELHKAGVLTDAELAAKKAELLARL